MAQLRLISVYRSEAFERHAPGLLGADGTEELVDFVAANPLAGEVVVGTGGVRKIRWARPGTGKRGGARILYYYHDDESPIALLTIYGKSDKDSLTTKEKSEFRKLAAALKQQIGDKQRDARKEKHHAPQPRQRGA
jgi:hypothetical protein